MEIFIIIVWVVCAFIAAGMAAEKNRPPAEGFALGLLLGVIGVIIEANLPTLPKN